MGDHFLKQIENISNQQNKEFALLLRGHLLNDTTCTLKLAFLCYNQGNVVMGAQLAIKCLDDASMYTLITTRLHYSTDLQELFILGKDLNVRTTFYTTRAVEVYESSTNKARNAVICFLLCTQDVLIQDIRQMIGKIIYEFRTDPGIWGVKIKKK